MITSRGGPKYRPYGVGDLQGIVDKLPPVSEGGSRWLSELDSLTAGQRLALGDFRAVLYRCTSNLDAKEIEAEARTAQKKDDVPFTQVSTDLGQALRQRYPPPNAATVPKLKWDGESSPREFLDKTRTQWIQQTGSHPGKPGLQMEWYRQAILEGVPLAVKEAIKSNPDMAGCDATKWEKHLIHHLTQVQDKCQTEQDQLKELQTQLLKLQLGDARGKATEKKQQTPPKKVMVAEQQPDWPDLNPTPPWVEPHHPHQIKVIMEGIGDEVVIGEDMAAVGVMVVTVAGAAIGVETRVLWGHASCAVRQVTGPETAHTNLSNHSPNHSSTTQAQLHQEGEEVLFLEGDHLHKEGAICRCLCSAAMIPGRTGRPESTDTPHRKMIATGPRQSHCCPYKSKGRNCLFW